MGSDGTESPVIVQQKSEDGLVPDIFAQTRVKVLQLDWLHLGGQDVLACTISIVEWRPVKTST